MNASVVEEALAAIPGRRDALAQEDDRLRRAVRFVERALFELEPGVPTHLSYDTPQTEHEPSAHWIGFEKIGKNWNLTWTDKEDAETVTILLQTPRWVRAEVFTPMTAFDGLAPIEMLIVKVAETLRDLKVARSPTLLVTDRLTKALLAAGFSET